VSPAAVPALAGEVSRWDFAWSRHERGGKAAERSPWTVRVRLGWTPRHPQLGRRWYIKHVLRMQGDPNQVLPLVLQTAQADGRHVPVLVPVDFSAGKVVVSDIKNLLEGFRVIEQGDKHVRIATLQNPAEARRIHIVAGEWNHPFLDEAARYPRRPVDQLDALAGAYLHVIESEGGLLLPEDIEASSEAMAPLLAAFGGRPARPALAWQEDDDPWGGDGGYGVPG